MLEPDEHAPKDGAEVPLLSRHYPAEPAATV